MLVVGLADHFPADVSGVDEVPVHEGREFLVLGGVRRQVVVDADAEALEIVLVFAGDPGDEFRGLDAFLLGLEHRRRAMRVARAHIDAFVAPEALEPHPDVRLDVFHEVAEVQ